MPSINIILIRRKNDGAAISAQSDIFHFERARGKQRRRTARRRRSSTNDSSHPARRQTSVCRSGEVKGFVGSLRGKRIVCLFPLCQISLPSPVAESATQIAQGTGRTGISGSFSWTPGSRMKATRAPIRRPARHDIAICAGSKIAHAVVAEIIDRDKAVIAAIANQRDLPSIGRPSWIRNYLREDRSIDEPDVAPVTGAIHSCFRAAHTANWPSGESSTSSHSSFAQPISPSIRGFPHPHQLPRLAVSVATRRL